MIPHAPARTTAAKRANGVVADVPKSLLMSPWVNDWCHSSVTPYVVVMNHARAAALSVTPVQRPPAVARRVVSASPA